MLAAYWNEKREFEGFWLAIVKRIEKGAFTLEWFEAPEYPAFKIPPKNIAERPDITMPELAGALAAATGEKADPASLSRWLIRAGYRFKKNSAGERARSPRRQASARGMDGSPPTADAA